MSKITCDQCEAECCRDVTVQIEKPASKEDWDDIRWEVAHKGVTVYVDNENDWVIEFKTDCEYLDKDNKCKIYKNRPAMCRKHTLHECVKNGEGEVHRLIFKTPEEVDEYLKNKVLNKKLSSKKK